MTAAMLTRALPRVADPVDPMSPTSGIAVRKSSTTEGKFSSPPCELSGRIVAFLRARYPAKTADCVAADTGLAAYSIAKWLSGSSLPNCFAVLALTCAYGPEFLASVLPHAPRWLDEAHRAEQQRALQTEIDDRRARLEALGG